MDDEKLKPIIKNIIVIINKEEVDEAKWIDIDELSVWIKNKPFEFTPWFIIIFPKIAEYIKKQYNYKLTIDEQLYLLIHIKRILDEQTK